MECNDLRTATVSEGRLIEQSPHQRLGRVSPEGAELLLIQKLPGVVA